MKTSWKDSLESEILSRGQDLYSAKNEDDSNALILPKRKKQKNKDKKKGHQNLKAPGDKKLSKSKLKMKKKLEEDKKKALLWSKSMEDVEKYKIQEDVYSFMWSSSNIGQVETVRDRRRREVLFSNAGLALPQSDQPLKTGVNPQCEFRTDSAMIYKSEVSEEITSLPQVICDVPAFSESLKEIVDRRGLSIDGEAGSVSTVKEVSQGSPHLAYECDEKPKNLEIEKPKDNSSTVNLVKCTKPRVLAAPIVVHVNRPKEVENTRKDLPIVMMEQEIMEAINENLNVIICGETGCGKTTQVPQFLYEAGFGSDKTTDRKGIIGVTQPRRVAVLATARRVAFELGVELGKEVGFQVQHNKNISKRCSIKVMTDGILLRELQSDFLLRKYSVLILDEAHERSLNTDILIGMLSRAIQQRQIEYEKQQGKKVKPEDKIYPLKLILMSATLQVKDFKSDKRIFHNPPPVIEVPTRQYPVTTYFSKTTDEVDYIGQAYKKVMSIHKKLPAGGILVFVTGVREVEYLCRKLRKASDDIVAINSRKNIKDKSCSVPVEDPVGKIGMDMINEQFGTNGDSVYDQYDRFNSFDETDGEFLDDKDDFSNDSESSDSDLEEIEEEDDKGLESIDTEFVSKDVIASLKPAFETLSGKNVADTKPDDDKVVPSIPKQKLNQFAGPMRVLPLYSMLRPEQQLLIFKETNEGERLIVVATNVAETSLTIPGIKYVVDTGREKVKEYNLSNGMESFEIQWISKASAAQRAGRAGRTGPGHCYRLYSSAAFSKFVDFSIPEILKRPIEDVVLRLKSMEIYKVNNFPFPTPPKDKLLAEADSCLKVLEALDEDGKLTPLGKAMSYYPMNPRHSRMLLTVIHMLRKSHMYKRAHLVLGYAVATASALTLSNPFVTRFEEISKNRNDVDMSKKKRNKEAFRVSRAKFSNPDSDALTVAYALQCFEVSENRSEFCNEYMLHFKTMEEMSKLRKQLLDIVFRQGKNNEQPKFVWGNGTTSDVERAWRVSNDKSPLLPNEEELLCEAICAGWADKVAKKTGGEMRVNAIYEDHVIKEPVFLHRRSSLFRIPPEFLVYNEMLKTNRPYIHGATRVKSEWLVKYAGSLCNFKPIPDRQPDYDRKEDHVLSWVDPTFGDHLWKLPSQKRPIEDKSDRMKAFAFCLLEGQVLPSLSDLKKFMRAQPSSILRPESMGQKRVGNLLDKLDKKSIDNCAKLKEVWDENPRELYYEIKDWFQEGYSDQFEKLWSEMQKEVKMKPRVRFPELAKRKRS